MPIKANPHLQVSGLVPARAVADALGKSPHTIHRWCYEKNLFAYARDGAALYINATSAEAYFVREGNIPLADIMRALRLEHEAAGKDALDIAAAEREADQ